MTSTTKKRIIIKKKPIQKDDTDDIEITNFDNIPITTMCLIYSLNHVINTKLLFVLAPIVKYDVDKKAKTKTKCKLTKLTGIPSHTIISANYLTDKRGIIRNYKKGMKNMIQTYLSIGEKVVYCTINPETVNIFGMKSIEQGHKTINIIFEIINEIDEIINNLDNSHFEYIENNMKISVKRIKLINGKIASSLENKLISIPEALEKLDQSDLSDNDKKYIKYLIGLSVDFDNYDSYIEKITWIQKNFCLNKNFTLFNDPVDSGDSGDSTEKEVEPLNFKFFYGSMINYNYSLECRIDLGKLSEIINSYDKFFSVYDSDAPNCGLNIQIPYDEIKNRPKNHNKEVPHHSIMVYKTGNITQSGPEHELNRDIYYKFISIIKQHINDIRSPF
jgi:hypothetical protein